MTSDEYTTSSPNSTSDDRWLAMQYVLGELDPASTTRVQDRLATDQSFRDALVDAVQYVDGLSRATAPQTSTRLIPQKHSTQHHWSLAATVCCMVALLIGGWAVSRNTSVPSETNSQIATQPDQLSRAETIALISGWNETAETGNEQFFAGEETFADNSSGLFDPLNGDTDLVPPDWLLAVVADETDSPTSPPVDL